MAIAIVLVFSAWVGWQPLAAAAPPPALSYDSATNTYTVLATGAEDTANLQGAFDGCAEQAPGCTIQLGAGTFHTQFVAGTDFHGAFRGAGQGVTIVEAMPNLVSTADDPLWLHYPSATNPYPDVFAFVDGAFTVSDMTIREPYAVPTTGWNAFGLHIMDLHAFILVTGSHADAVIRDVTFVGAAGSESSLFGPGFNVINGVYYEGLMLEDPTPDSAMIPLTGSFLAEDNTFLQIAGPLQHFRTQGASVIYRNNFVADTVFPVVFQDGSDSYLEATGNTLVDVQGFAIWAFQDTMFGALEPSQLVIARNIIEAPVGIYVADGGEIPTLDTLVAQNTIRVTDPAGGVGIDVEGVPSFAIQQNEIRGPGAAGIFVYANAGTIARNTVRGMAEGIIVFASTDVCVCRNEVAKSALYGIEVVLGSSDVSVIQNTVRGSGEFDLYWDGTGIDNVWMKNEYRTSSPSGL